MDDKTQPLTVDQLVGNPSRVAARLLEMEKQRLLMTKLIGERQPPTRRQRLAYRSRWTRESIARWIAPWLE
jgi:hypothetical protein